MTRLSRRHWLKSSLAATAGVLVGTRSIDSFATGSYAGFSDELLRLNWNENPYGPSPAAVQAASEVLATSNRYPDTMIEVLTSHIAKVTGTSADQIMLTAGSTEVLTLLGQHVGIYRGEIVTAWPSFPTMLNYCTEFGGSVKHVPLDSSDRLDLDRMLRSIGPNTRMIFVCNPNNPTATEIDRLKLIEFLQHVPGNVLVCVDEAYIEFSKGGTPASVVDQIDSLDNLIVARTFSKAYGLAGMRIGYAMAQKAMIDELRSKHQGYSFNLSLASVVAANTALDDQVHLNSGIESNTQARAILYAAFDKWGVQYTPSSTNFVYARASHFVPNIVQELRKQNVLITKWPIMKDSIRISLGTPAQMEQFVGLAGHYIA